MTTEERIQAALAEVRPALRADGGDVELVGFEGGVAHVRLKGACSGCPASGETLRRGVEAVVRKRCPEVREVRQVHGSGGPAREEGCGSTSPGQDVSGAGGMPPLLPGVSAIVAVASGKGGVGKSTVAVNLALALHRLGLSVGLLDADIYGPSIPTMLGVPRGQPPRPAAAGSSGNGKIAPLERFGISLMSIGFFLDPRAAVIWRGPLVVRALEQFLEEVAWGDLDCLVVDLPPGTGDVQISLAQKVPLTGAIVVTTSSDVALVDARRAVAMFDRVDVPTLGVVENMSFFLCPHCGQESDVFARGGGKAIARETGVPFLGEIPLDPAIRAGGDGGKPVVATAPASALAAVFLAIAGRVKQALDRIRRPGEQGCPLLG